MRHWSGIVLVFLCCACVSQPIYRSGLDQWRHFEAHLDPLKQALGPEVRAAFGIDTPQ